MKNGKIKASATKLIALLLLLCTVTLMFSSCGNDVKIEKPEDTNLEYWLLDKPNKKDFTYIDKIGHLSNEYEPIVNDDGSLSAPQEYVAYHFGNYPTDEIGIDRILYIQITDPDVSVWGLTINSTKEEIVETFSKMGFYIDGPWEERCNIRNEKLEIYIFYNKKIIIQRKVISIGNSIYFGKIAYTPPFGRPKE